MWYFTIYLHEKDEPKNVHFFTVRLDSGVENKMYMEHILEKVPIRFSPDIGSGPDPYETGWIDIILI